MKGNLIGKVVKVEYQFEGDEVKIGFGRLIDWDAETGFCFLEDNKLGHIGIPIKSIRKVVERPHYQADSYPIQPKKPIEKGWKSDKYVGQGD